MLPEVIVPVGIVLGSPLLTEYALPFQYLLPQRIGCIISIIVVDVDVDLCDIEIPFEEGT